MSHSIRLTFVLLLLSCSAFAKADKCPRISNEKLQLDLGAKTIELSLVCREHKKRAFYTFKIYNAGDGHFLLNLIMRRDKPQWVQFISAFHSSEKVFQATDPAPSRKAKRKIPGLLKKLIAHFSSPAESEIDFEEITKTLQAIIRADLDFGEGQLPF